MATKLIANLINKNKIMKIIATEHTSTFPIPLNKLKGNLMDNVGVKWSTDHGEFELTTETIPWIVANAKKSMYNNGRTYIYNKAFASVFNESYNTNDRFELIRQWAHAKGIYDKGDSKTQYIKLMEEAGELAKALLTNDRAEIVDAIGDIAVVLTNLAALEKLTIEDCIDSAYNEIKGRKGKMNNGTFVKNTL